MMNLKTPQNVTEAIKKLGTADQVVVQTFIAKLKSTVEELQAELSKVQGHHGGVSHSHDHDHCTSSHSHCSHSHGDHHSNHDEKYESSKHSVDAKDQVENDEDTSTFPPMYESGEDYDAATTYKMEAADLKSQEKYAEALEKYNLAICAAPPSALLLANRADTLFHLSNYSAAVRDCTAALEQNPDSAKALRIRGRCYKETGDYEESRKDLSAAQTIDYEDSVVPDLKFVCEKCMEVETQKAHERVQEEERLRKRAEQIRKAREEQAKQDKVADDDDDSEYDASPGMGGFPGSGGMGGMPGMPPGAMGMMSQLFSDPEIAEGLKNPKVMAAMSKLMSNPGGAMAGIQSLMSDPEVAPVMQKIMAKMGPLFGGMGRGATTGTKTSGDDEDMPDLDIPDI